MNKCIQIALNCCLLLLFNTALATHLKPATPPPPTLASAPKLQPHPPKLSATAYVLMDVNSGKVIAEKNANKRLPPASLTKMMSLYIISSALNQGRINLTDNVTISTKAWKTGGARMFLRSGEKVTVADLIKGVVVQSGNDATVALAEHIAGTEADFTTIMNQTAQLLNLHNTHFADSTGMPLEGHYSTSKDLATLGLALINDFPDYYAWYQQKWFSHNGIRQPNRNRLLWRNPEVDGIKTGHTKEAGFCLVASAKHEHMRLLSVVMGAPNDNARADESQRLLNYGFRFFKTYTLYHAGQALEQHRVWLGQDNKISVGLRQDLVVTIPRGDYKDLTAEVKINKALQAPLHKGQQVGELTLKMHQQLIRRVPIVTLQENLQAGVWSRLKDRVQLSLYRVCNIKNI
jgi:serine-type D-Ala-D-Ala carboxypeptidase (penicillin-binding protein 5/6)